MKEIAPQNTRYIPLTQQRWCCVPACISMIMYKRGIPLVAQEELGYHLGLVVPDESKHLFYNPRVGEEPSSGYGTQISKTAYHPNTAFKKLGIPLVMIFHPINKFENEKEFTDFILGKIKADADLVASYSNLEFSDGHIQGGHACVVDQIFTNNGTIRLIDPERNQPKWQTHNISKLYKAMQKHGPAKMGGLWEFVQTK